MLQVQVFGACTVRGEGAPTRAPKSGSKADMHAYFVATGVCIERSVLSSACDAERIGSWEREPGAGPCAPGSAPDPTWTPFILQAPLPSTHGEGAAARPHPAVQTQAYIPCNIQTAAHHS